MKMKYFLLLGFLGLASASPGCMDNTKYNYNPDATEDDGSCLDKADGDFKMVTSESCSYYGYRVITNLDECGRGLDWAGTTVYNSYFESQYRHDMAYGCIDDGYYSKVNLRSWSVPSCGDSGRDCICVEQLPVCPQGVAYVEVQNTVGVTATECKCDPIRCNSGQICNAGACSSVVVMGCTDPAAFNYDENANTDDGSCVAVVTGCTDPTVPNYDASANTDNGSCQDVCGIEGGNNGCLQENGGTLISATDEIGLMAAYSALKCN